MANRCAVFQTTSFIGKRWTLLILLELYKGKQHKRFTELKKSIPGITPKILSSRLKELQKEGLISNSIDSTEIPVKSIYCLSDSGKDFMKIIRDMKNWSVRWKKQSRNCEKTDCKTCKL